MPVPEFIVKLRAKIGHDSLPISGIAAVVFDEQGRVLLVRSADNGRWTLVTGCLEPGEQPAVGAVREVAEETGVKVTVERLLAVESLGLSQLPNGDQLYILNIGLLCRHVAGEARVNDDESVEVGWFDPAMAPPLPAHQARCLELALAGEPEPWFAR
ncbi:NUDIX domain-containing protein [Actinoplanes sp. GCM10030250]|uniref:NUDIX hydrolase n=1 Tax=Actinoplanes sp. GCM10030250 TaxID=3273376 RepID=UPI0036205B85